MAQTGIGTTGYPHVSVLESATVGGRRKAVPGGGRLCQACGQRRARFAYRGTVKADRAHTLCFECFRAARNRLRARAMAVLRLAQDALSSSKGGRTWLAPLASPAPAASKMLGDRPGLYAELYLRLRRAQLMARHALAMADDQPAAKAMAS
jgi:hypothetical protein